MVDKMERSYSMLLMNNKIQSGGDESFTPVSRPWWKFWGKKAVPQEEAELQGLSPRKTTLPGKSNTRSADPLKLSAKSSADAKVPSPIMKEAVPKEPEVKTPEKKIIPPPVAKPSGPIQYRDDLDILPPIPLETMVQESQEMVLKAIENGQDGLLKEIDANQKGVLDAISGGNANLDKTVNQVAEKLEKSAKENAQELKNSLTKVDSSIDGLRSVNEKSLDSMDQMSSLMKTVESGVKGMQGEVAKSTKAYDELVKKSEETAQRQAEEMAALQKKTLLINLLLGLAVIGVIIAWLTRS